MKNKIVHYGEIGEQLCMLNKSKEELVELINKTATRKIAVDDVRELEFDDCFIAYDLWRAD